MKQSILTLQVQGATNIAFAVLEGIHKSAEFIHKEQFGSVYDELKHVGEVLAYARPTEPLAQNAVRYVFDRPGEQKEYYLRRADAFGEMIRYAKERMVLEGCKYIENGGVYLTHCHSSTVLSIFKKAYRLGKRFAVYATETRPLYQGRKTVRELLDAGITDVTLIIDDVATSLLEGSMKQVNGVFVGADLFSKEGFGNKVGTLGIGFAAKYNNVPFYSIGVLLKYDPRPFTTELIEQRSPQEIWPEAPAGLQFYAPAFDFVPYTTGVRIISEAGVIYGNNVFQHVHSLYPFII